MKRKNYPSLAVGMLAALLLTHCSNTLTEVSDRWNQEGNLSGTVCTADGTPVINASVTLVSEDYAPLGQNSNGIIDSIRSDAQGRYRFDVPRNGTYNLFADGDDLYGMHPSIQISTEGHLALAQKALTEPGILSGTVRLEGMTDHQNTVILLPGTNCYTRPASNGSYRFPALAEGTYTIRFLSMTSEFSSFDTSVVVISENETVLGEVLLLKETMPSVTSLSVEYDPRLMKAVLTWEAGNETPADSFFLFCNRDKNLEPIMKLPGSVTTATFDILTETPDTNVYQVVAAGENGWISAPATSDTVITRNAFTRTVHQVPYDLCRILSRIESFAYSNYFYGIDSANVLVRINPDFQIDAQYEAFKDIKYRLSSLGLPMTFTADGNCHVLTAQAESREVFSTTITSYSADLNPAGSISNSEVEPLSINSHFAMSSSGYSLHYTYETVLVERLVSDTAGNESTSKDHIFTTFIRVFDPEFNLVSETSIPEEHYRIMDVRDHGDHLVVTIVRDFHNIHEIITFDNSFNRISSFTPDTSVIAKDLPEGFSLKPDYFQLGPEGYSLFAASNPTYDVSTTKPSFTLLILVDENNHTITRLPTRDYHASAGDRLLIDAVNGNMYCGGPDINSIVKYTPDLSLLAKNEEAE